MTTENPQPIPETQVHLFFKSS